MTGKLSVGSVYRKMVKAEVVAETDVLVAGGGTAGCVAAIAAARNGASVLLVERQGYLGGMMTAGNAGLTKYIVHDKNQTEYRKIWNELATNPAAVQAIGGIPMELTRRLIDEGAGLATFGQPGSYVFTAQHEFKRLLLTMMEEAGVKLLLHSLCVDVVVQEGQIKGLVVENKSGRQVLLAKVVIDATGDADVAAKAGVPFILGVGPDDVAAKSGTAPLGSMQRMGVMFRLGNIDMKRCFAYLFEHPERYRPQPFALMSLQDSYDAFVKGDMMTINIALPDHWFQIYNTPIPGVFTFCCPSYEGSGLSSRDLTDAELALTKEVWRRVDVMKALPGFEQAYVVDIPEICVRETRHPLGEYVLDIEDILTMKQFEDSIGRGCHPIDISPIPEYLHKNPLPPRWSFSIPYGSLVAKGISNLLYAGRCISNTHEASGCTRPTVQCMVTGQAAGTAAALCATENVAARDIDGRRLRKLLAEQGAIV